jgi:hypothetical protein
MPNVTIKVPTGHVNLSPVLFQNGARDYFKASLDFKPPHAFSAVPFFLCCRAIELAFKALHLETKSQIEVKKLYNHDLVKSYDALDPGQQTLSPDEKAVLVSANVIYVSKEFEYLGAFDAGSGFARFPQIDALSALARKITRYNES